MPQHEIEKLIIRPLRIGEAKLDIRRLLLAQQRTDRNAHCSDQLFQTLATRWILQILDDDWLLAALPDHRQHVPGRQTTRIVIDRDGHSSAFAFKTSVVPQAAAAPTSRSKTICAIG